MNCRDLLRALDARLDGGEDAALCAELDRHLAECPSCRIVMDTAQKTIRLYRDGAPYALPADFRRKLHRALRGRWKKKSS